MNRRAPLLLLILILSVMTACQSYTARQGFDSIPVPTQAPQDLPVTKYSIIQASHLAEVAQQQAESDQQMIQRMQREAEQLQSILENKGRQIDQLSDLLDQKDGEIEELKMAIILLEKHDASSAVQLGDALIELSDLKQRHRILVEERDGLQDRLTEAQTEITQLEEELTTRLQQGEEYLEQLALHEEEIDELGRTIERLQNDLTDTSSTIAVLQEKNHSLEQERQQLSFRLRQTEEVLATYRQAELEVLKSEEDRSRALAAQAEQERRLAQEREELQRQIPSIEQLSLPHLFTPNAAVSYPSEENELKTVILPLSDARWTDEHTASEVAHSISDLNYPLILVTGAMENVIALVRQLGSNAVLVDGGAIITSLPILETTTHGAKVRYNEQKTVRVLIANLEEYEVLSAFEEGGQRWMEVQKQITPARIHTLQEILSEGTVVEPTIIGASLYEPSHRDWNTFSPIEYRQIDYLWPLVASLEEANFFDAYRMTHFSSATDSGNTFIKAELQERLDYLFSRKLLPLRTSMVPIGSESVPKEAGGIQRWGIMASYLIP